MQRRQAGFTIFELVIVLVMVGILTAGMAPMLRIQHTRTMEEANRQALATAKDVVVSWALANGGLPVPLTSAATTAKPEYLPTYPAGWTSGNESYLPWDEHMVSTATNLPPLGVPTIGSYRKYFWYDPREQLRRDFSGDADYLPLAETLSSPINPRVAFCANVRTLAKAPGTSDPRVCRLPRTGEETAACPGTAAEATPAAFAIASFGNDRTPDKAHAAFDVVSATKVRNYENPARPVNFEHSAAPDVHYDDAVASVSLAELASRCDQSGVVCSANQRYLTIGNASGSAYNNLYYKLGTGTCTAATTAANARNSPGCLDSATTLWTDSGCGTAFTAANLSDADSNGDGVAAISNAGTTSYR